MDPNAALIEARKLLAHQRRNANGPLPSDLDDLARLADLFEALDRWISQGGFPPRDWQPPVDAVTRGE